MLLLIALAVLVYSRTLKHFANARELIFSISQERVNIKLQK